MKRYFLLFFTLLHLSLNAYESILDISSESVIVHNYNESEYIEAGYVIDDIFSTGLEVYSATQDTKITLDGKTYRTESLKISDLEEGKYYLEVSARGYKTFRTFITIYSDKRTIIFITLAREYGYLDVETNAENTELYLNGYRIVGNEPIPTGVYNLQVKSFGYTEEYRVISIYDGFVSKETFNLEAAPFQLEKLTLSKRVINPYAEEGFAKLLITVSVNGPGEGILEIKDNSGKVISTIDLVFSDWKTQFYINRSDYLPEDDGLYQFKVSSEDQIIIRSITVDSQLQIKMANATTGSNGLIHSPTAEINIIPTHQSSFNLLYNSSENFFTLPISYSYNFNRYMELMAGFLFSLNHDTNNMVFNAYSSMKTAKQWGNLSTALDLQYKFVESERQSYITIQTPLTYNIDNISINLCPSYVLDFSLNQEISGSFGLIFDNQSIRTGLSLSIDENLSYITGYEIWKLIPDSQTYMGVNISYGDNSDFTIGFGLTNIN